MKKILQFSIPSNKLNFGLTINQSFEYLKVITIENKHSLHVLADMNTPLREVRYVLFVNGASIPVFPMKHVDSFIHVQDNLLVPLHLFEVLE